MSGYVLGVNERERARLRFQQEVWGPVTERFLDRLWSVPAGAWWTLGAAPGS